MNLANSRNESSEKILLDLATPDFAPLARHAGRIHALLNTPAAASEPELFGSLDGFIGALYYLALAKRGGFTDRIGGDIEQEAVIKRAGQLSQGRIRTTGKWMAGCHFNSALYRTAAVNHRVLKFVTGKDDKVGPLQQLAAPRYRQSTGRDWTFDNSTKVHKQVNNPKHDPDGTYHTRTVQYEELAAAVEEIINLLEATTQGAGTIAPAL